MSHDPNSPLLQRIKKLLALANSPNANEAAAALAKARQLMDDNGISSSTLEQADYGMVQIEGVQSRMNKHCWEFEILKCVNRAFGVTSHIVPGSLYKHWKEAPAVVTLIGDHASIQVASYAYHVLARGLKRAGAQFAKEHELHQTRTEMRAFKLAWINAVYEKCCAIAPKKTVEQVAALKLAQKRFFPNSVPCKNTASQNASAAWAANHGHAEGSKFQLHHGMNGAEQLRLA